MLAKGASEPSTGCPGYYSNIFIAPKHILHSILNFKQFNCYMHILNFKQFNCYMHIPTFKIPTVRKVGQLIQQGDFAFSIDLKDAYLHIPIVKHHHHFLKYVWPHQPYQWKVLPFRLAADLGCSPCSINPYCSFAITRFAC